jgi:L-lactate dehydrogenase complex protein LldG
MEPTENPGRERILERIRTALQKPTRPPAPVEAKPVFAPVTNALERFQAECKANLTEVILAADAGASAAAIKNVLASLPTGEIFVQDAPEFRRRQGSWADGRAVRWSSEGAPSETAQATLSLAELLVALTGSILVSASCGGRGASIVAPCHIVLAKLDQLVPDLESAFARVRERNIQVQNSFVGLITGSSRTADIEKILVQGAHGPRRLVVVLQTGS